MSHRVAKKYIHAFVEVTSQKSNLKQIKQSIKLLQKVINLDWCNKALKSHNKNYLLLQLTETLAEKLDDEVVNLLKLLQANKRADILPLVIDGINHELADDVKTVYITTATAINDDTIKQNILENLSFLNVKPRCRLAK